MDRYVRLLALSAGAVFAQTRPSAAPMPPAEKLLERHARESGAARMEAASTQVLRGRFTLPQEGASGKITVYSDKDGRTYQVMELPGFGKMESGNDGDIEWERSTVGGPKVKRVASTPGSLLGSASVAGAFLRYDPTAGTRTVGQSTVNGKPCWLVESRPSGAAHATRMCFDWETGLLVRTSGVVADGDSKFHVETTLSNYKQVGAIKAPFVIESNTGGSPMRIDVDEIRFDEKPPAEAFEVPEEVQAIAREQLREVEIKEPEEDPDRPRLKRRKKR